MSVSTMAAFTGNCHREVPRDRHARTAVANSSTDSSSADGLPRKAPKSSTDVTPRCTASSSKEGDAASLGRGDGSCCVLRHDSRLAGVIAGEGSIFWPGVFRPRPYSREGLPDSREYGRPGKMEKYIGSRHSSCVGSHCRREPV
jgi:hypothetical protein